MAKWGKITACEAMARVSTPIEQMRELMKKGEAFWIEDLTTYRGRIESATVRNFGSEWIEIQPDGTDQNVWVNLAHIISFKLVEG